MPKELLENYTLETILFIKSHNTLLTISSKAAGQRFVLKILEKGYDDRALAKVLQQLPDKGLLLPIERYSDKTCCYLIYPFMQTLSDILLQDAFPYSAFCRLVDETGAAIAALHQQMILHLDITPENLFVDEKGSFFLGDFSSSRFVKKRLFSPLRKALRTGTTPPFAPSEASCPVSFWHDQYSFALLLYLLLNNGAAPQEESAQNVSSFPYTNKVLQEAMKAPKQTSKDSFFHFITDLHTALEKDEQPLDIQSSLPLNCLPKVLPLAATPVQSAGCHSSFPHTDSSRIPLPLYGLLLSCGILFLCSLCYYILQGQKQAATLPDSPITASSTQAADSLPSSLPSLSSKTNSPFPSSQQTVSPAPSQKSISLEQTSSAPKQVPILKLSASASSQLPALQDSLDCSFVKILFAGNCHFTEDSSLSAFTNLEELYLHDNPIRSVHTISKLSHLKILVLSNSKVTNISKLSSLSSLTMLDLSQNDHLKGIRALRTLKKLSYLIVTNTNITQKDIRFLQKKLPRCTILY